MFHYRILKNDIMILLNRKIFFIILDPRVWGLFQTFLYMLLLICLIRFIHILVTLNFLCFLSFWVFFWCVICLFLKLRYTESAFLYVIRYSKWQCKYLVSVYSIPTEFLNECQPKIISWNHCLCYFMFTTPC